MQIDQNMQNLIPPQVMAPQPFLLATALLKLAGHGWLSYGAAVEMQKDHKGRYTIKFTFTPSAVPKKYVAQFIFQGSKQVAYVPPVGLNGNSIGPWTDPESEISAALAGAAACRYLNKHQLLPAHFRLSTIPVNQFVAELLDVPWPDSEYCVLIRELPGQGRLLPNVVFVAPTFDICGVSILSVRQKAE